MITANGAKLAAGIGSGRSASCATITITDGVTQVTAAAGVGSWNTTLHSIGAGNNGSCAGVTLGGTVYWDGSSYQNNGNTILETSPYRYTPGY